MKNFKLYLLSLIGLCSFCLFSCTDDDELTLTIRASGYDVVKDLKNIDGENYFTGKLPDDTRLRINFYLYEVAATLSGSENMVAKGTVLLDDITGVAEFTTVLDVVGNYQAVTVCDIVKVSNNNITMEYNTIDAPANRPRINVSQQNQGGYLSAFGAANQEISVESSTTQDVYPKPAGGLITVQFNNIDIAQFPTLSYYIDGEKYGNYNVIDKRVSSADRTMYEIKPEANKYYWHQLYCVPNIGSDVHWGITALWRAQALPITGGVNHYVVVDVSAQQATIYNEVPKK